MTDIPLAKFMRTENLSFVTDAEGDGVCACKTGGQAQGLMELLRGTDANETPSERVAVNAEDTELRGVKVEEAYMNGLKVRGIPIDGAGSPSKASPSRTSPQRTPSAAGTHKASITSLDQVVFMTHGDKPVSEAAGAGFVAGKDVIEAIFRQLEDKNVTTARVSANGLRIDIHASQFERVKGLGAQVYTIGEKRLAEVAAGFSAMKPHEPTDDFRGRTAGPSRGKRTIP